MEHDAWWDKGACKDADPRDFEIQPIRGRTPRSGQRRQQDWSAARTVCRGCTVQEACLMDQLRNPPISGDSKAGLYVMFAAGYTPDQLTDLRRHAIAKGIV